MFMEQAAYVGDVLSFYLDNQIQENFLQYARQNDNLYDLAYMYGYKPKVTGLAETDIEFFQQVPSILVNGIYESDYSYALYINSNTQISTNNGTGQKFAIEDPIDFSVSSSLDPTEVSVASLSGGNPQFYLLKKTRKGFSGTILSKSFNLGAYQ